MKKILVSAYCQKNLGDDLFLKILFERYPDVNFILLADRNVYKKIFQYSNVFFKSPPKLKLHERLLIKLVPTLSNKFNLLKSWRKIINKMSFEIDGYLIIGGSMFIEKKKHTVKYDVSEMIIEALKDKKKLILGANFGPYFSQNFHDYFYQLFQNFDDVCFRDKTSSDLFKLPFVRNNPDIVFSLKYPKIDKKMKTVGFSLIDLTRRPELNNYETDYVKLIKTLIISYINDGYDVYLFSFCKIEGDDKIISKIMGKIPPTEKNKINLVGYNGNIDSFIKIFGSMECMFATRFHAMILGFLFNQKVYPLVYSDKTINTLNYINFPASYLKLNEIDTVHVDQIKLDIESNIFDIGQLPSASEQHFLKLDEFCNTNTVL